MARKASHAISYRLTKFETIAGWLYLPFYLLILNLLLQLANMKSLVGIDANGNAVSYYERVIIRNKNPKPRRNI